MFQSHSRSAMTAFLLTLLATDAVFGGIVHVQRASASQNKATVTQVLEEPSDPNAHEIQELKSVESNEASVGPESSDKKLVQKSPPPGDALDFPWLEDNEHDVRTHRKQESANAATDAIASLIAAAVSVLTRPLINTLPGYINNGIVGFVGVLSGMATNATLELNATVPVDNKVNETSRQARDFSPAYGADGVVNNGAVSWLMNEEINRAEFMDGDNAPFLSLRGPDTPGRFTLMEPLLTAFGFFRRTVALQFMASVLVMSMAHLGRILLMNLPQILSVFGLGRQTTRRVQTAIEEASPEEWSTQNSNVDSELLRDKAEQLAKQLVEAVTRDQCAERAACFMGAYCSQYSYTPSIMKYLRSPKPDVERPDHPVWLAFRDAAEGRVQSDSCNQTFQC